MQTIEGDQNASSSIQIRITPPGQGTALATLASHENGKKFQHNREITRI
jgi:hypothetical protein